MSDARLTTPLVREGGVLMRSGHTEAAVDLCKLAASYLSSTATSGLDHRFGVEIGRAHV